MVYAYIRVSTDKQTVENQRFEVQKFATEKGLVIDKWVSEKVSGTKIANDRKLGPLLKRMKKGDTLIITEISRLGRNLMGIMSMLHLCMIKETCVLTVKERYELGNNINRYWHSLSVYPVKLNVTLSVSEPRRPLLTEKLQEYDLVEKRG